MMSLNREVEMATMSETLAHLNRFTRSAFGLDMYLVTEADGDSDAAALPCSCGSLTGEREEECRLYQGRLFAGTSLEHTTCPGGYTVLSRAFPRSDTQKVLLRSGAYTSASGGNGKGSVEEDGSSLPRLGTESEKSLGLFFDVAALSLGDLGERRVEAALETVQEKMWRDSRGRESLLGNSPAIVRLRDALPTLANGIEPVLIESEPGNGRHLTASIIHRLGPRYREPLISESLSTLQKELHERTLFGPRGDGGEGLFSLAEGGTLYLEGIDRLSPKAQIKMAAALKEKGKGKPSTTPKIIVASSPGLAELVRKGRFESALYETLRLHQVFIPPLRDRLEDLALLAEHLLCRNTAGNGNRKGNGNEKGKGMGKEHCSLTGEAFTLLTKHTWPGNVRELEKELSAAAAPGRLSLGIEDFSPVIQSLAPPEESSPVNLKEAVGTLEKRMMTRTLNDTNWNKSRAARVLGLSRLGLQKKIDRYGLDRRR